MTVTDSLSATFPLSSQQQRFHDMSGYPRSSILAIAGHFSRVPAPELIRAALRSLIARHDALRLVVAPDAYTQYLDHHAEPNVDVIEVGEDELAMRSAFATWYVRRPLAMVPHSGVAIFRRTDGSGYLVPWGHHAVIDGSSLTVLSNDLATACAELAGGARPAERRTPSYRDFIEWEASYEQSEDCDHDLAFWKSRFPAVPGSSLRRRGDDDGRPPAWDVVPSRTRIPSEAYAHFRNAAQSALGSTFDAFLLIAATLVGAFSGARVAHIMIPTLNRIAPFRPMAGTFASQILVSVVLDPDETASQAIRAAQRSVIEMYQHQRIASTVLRDRGNLDMTAPGVHFDLLLTFFPDTAQQLVNTFDGVPCDDDFALRDPAAYCPFQLTIFEPGYRSAANVDVGFRPDYFRDEDVGTIGRAIAELIAAFAADPLIRVGNLLERARVALAPALVTG
jgi:Condensation domain